MEKSIGREFRVGRKFRDEIPKFLPQTPFFPHKQLHQMNWKLALK